MDIYAQTQKELDSFFHDKIHIAGTSNNENARYLSSKGKNFEFSQWEMVNLIDLYYNSKFESGHYDTEGQRKLFLNICKFRADVAAKQIDLDVKDFTFVPEDTASVWGAFLIGKEFRMWAKENYFGELINKCVEAFPRYGWVVLKEVKGELEFVPLQVLRNQQDAKSLNDAKWVTIEHKGMTREDIEANKNWDTENLSLKAGETTTVYERYGMVSLYEYNEYKGEPSEEGDEDKMVDCLTICTIALNDKGKVEDGNILFMEQIKKRPFVEAHWSTQFGRLMGVGEIENQLENQIGSNMSFNLYRRQLLWSSKKIFQSADDGIAKNLVRDVKDGDVLQISPNGNITQVDMGNRAAGDFNNFSQILDKNSDQKSFTYEVATGASLPSGTPFRLGVLMANSVNSHFDMKREKLGMFLKKGIEQLILPTFKKQFSSEHVVSMFSSEEGFDALKKITTEIQISKAKIDAIINGEPVDPQMIAERVQADMEAHRHLFIDIPDSFYDDLKYKVTLTVTGEEIDIPKKIETLTNLYTALSQRQDPRAEKVLERILAYTGESFDLLVGAPQAPQGALPPGATPSPMQASTLAQPSTGNLNI